MSNSTQAIKVNPLQSLAEDFSREKIGFIIAVSCLVLLDGVNGAVCPTLPRYLNGSLAVTTDQVAWAAIFYYVGKLYMLVMSAKLQSIWGQRRSFLTVSTALVVLTATGMLVPNYACLLLVLLLQGAAGGAMTALGQGTLLMLFPRREQPLVQGAYLLAALMFPVTVVPEVLGGCAYNFDWRNVYLCMLPFGLLGCAWLFWKQKMLSDSVGSSPLLPIRLVLMLTALFAIVYVLEQGSRNRWLEYPPIVWAILLALTCVAAIAFLETRGGATLLSYESFHYANFTFVMCVVILAGIAFFGGGFVISGYAINVLAYPVSTSGLVQLSGMAFSVVSFLSIGVLLRFTKINPAFYVLTGMLLFGISMWQLGLAPSNLNFEGFASWLTLRGFALGCQFLPLTLLALTCLPGKDNVAAAGLFNFNRQIGVLIGIAWLQTLHEDLTDRNQTIFGNALSSRNPNTMMYAQKIQDGLALHGIPTSQIPSESMALTVQEANRQWANIAYNGCFECLAVMFLVAFPLIALARILTTRFLKPPVCQ
ncbi:MAG TPA: MFS transporter [Candidatus Acidoferrales bacterium]|nr:MFS transporter [Candidatus Acidoferrales bacterium]